MTRKAFLHLVPRTLHLLAPFTLLVLPSCGFTPMYGTAFQSKQQADIQAELAQVEIANIPNSEGQYLRNALIDRFYKDQRPENPRYTLKISQIRESKVDLDITKTSDATRGQLRLNTEMVLIDNQTEAAVLTRKLATVSSYNILSSEFATRVSEDNTRKNALDELARQAELQIGLYLHR
ncbi:MAG: hypothetical protein KDI13_06290 [Alphaproteobacteria bacterium]|nr:hypothetical protein [Alphaproteobacteria bacterium]